jgi:hypothetical protein
MRPNYQSVEFEATREALYSEAASYGKGIERTFGNIRKQGCWEWSYPGFVLRLRLGACPETGIDQFGNITESLGT